MQTRKVCTTYHCVIPEEYLQLPWDDLPQDIKDIIDQQGGLPCDGGGNPGDWCFSTISHCYWFGGSESEDVDDQ